MSTPADPDDADRTVLRADAGAAPAPGPAALDDPHFLPLGTRLHEFELTQRIGEGGFSIVYLAWDHSLQRQVALKEYMPGSLAMRVDRAEVTARTERHRETFDAGLKSFINEARLLAQFDHPALVKVFRFWEANGTAYMAMPFYRGTTLKDAVRAMPAPPDEAWLLGMLDPLTAALDVIHQAQCFHRDIAPDNVILLEGDPTRPLLLDFGAARRVIGDMTQALTVILKPGYAPIEQYAEVPGMRQGAWTDLYALAAAVYWCATGRTPPPSVGRMMHDSHVPLAQAAAGRYSAGFLAAIDRALVVAPEQRTQTVAAFRAGLGLDAGATAPRASSLRAVDPDATVILAPAAQGTAREPGGPASGSVTMAGARSPSTVPPSVVPGRHQDDATVAFAALKEPMPAPARTRRGLLLGGGAFGLAALGAGLWWTWRSGDAVPATAASPAPVPAAVEMPPPASPSSAAAPAPAPDQAPAAAVVPEPASEPAPPAATAANAPAPEPVAAPAPAPAPAAARPARAARTERRERTAPSSDTQDPARKAECARILQRLSLEEPSPALLERARALNCH